MLYAEDAKQTAKQERNKIEEQRIREKKKKEDAIEMELEERAQEEIQATLEEPSDQLGEMEPMNKSGLQKRNMMDTPCLFSVFEFIYNYAHNIEPTHPTADYHLCDRGCQALHIVLLY